MYLLNELHAYYFVKFTSAIPDRDNGVQSKKPNTSEKMYSYIFPFIYKHTDPVRN